MGDTPTIEQQIDAVEGLAVTYQNEANVWDAMTGMPSAPASEQADVDQLMAETLRAAVETLRQMQWRPIETAPKDGVSILILRNCCAFQARWRADLEAWDILFGSLVLCGKRDERKAGITHWMPLPPSPEDKA